MALKENYVDDILDTSKNTKRKYNMITNADGTVSFEDVTEYSQNGDSFGSADINAITKKVNKSLTKKDVTIEVASGYGSVIATNSAKIENDTLYIDAIINITQEIPNGGNVFKFYYENSELAFNKRHDIIWTGFRIINSGNEAVVNTRALVYINSISSYFTANGLSIPTGSYQLKTIIDLDA